MIPSNHFSTSYLQSWLSYDTIIFINTGMNHILILSLYKPTPLPHKSHLRASMHDQKGRINLPQVAIICSFDHNFFHFPPCKLPMKNHIHSSSNHQKLFQFLFLLKFMLIFLYLYLLNDI